MGNCKSRRTLTEHRRDGRAVLGPAAGEQEPDPDAVVLRDGKVLTAIDVKDVTPKRDGG